MISGTGYAKHEATTCLDQYLGSFEASLTPFNYKLGTIKAYCGLIRRLGSIMQERGIRPAGLTVELAADLVKGEERNRREPHKYANIARRFTRHLIEIGVAQAAPPTAKQTARDLLRRGYEDYLRRQRGLSEETIYHCWRFADRFLDFRFRDDGDDMASITSADVADFLLHITGRKAPFKDKTPPTHLRNFFRYLFKNGATATNLALCVPSVAQRYGQRLPRYLQADQVEALLAAVRSAAKNGQRNYAMMLLMARLGLRAPEVIAIQLDDIDWRTGELLVRGKGLLHDRVPILPDVGEAIAAYIQHDRASCTSRALFVTERAPHEQFKDGQILNSILRESFAATGLKPPCPYGGSHVLRHSLATNMARNGASLAEIGDMLRHRSRATTMIYARLDIEGLRSIAQNWPVAGGVR
jgi:integrase/recombinase XerD